MCRALSMSSAGRLGLAVAVQVPLAADQHVGAVGLRQPAADGSTTIAPYMPLAMCASTGGVPQWYMKTPGSLAVKLEREALARLDVLERPVRGDARGVEVDRVRDRAVVASASTCTRCALPHVDHGPRRAAGERPPAELHAGRDLEA